MFDLEKEIKVWKKGFGKYESFEDGLVADMELHLREAHDVLKAGGLADEAAFRKAVAQVGTAATIAREYISIIVAMRVEDGFGSFSTWSTILASSPVFGGPSLPKIGRPILFAISRLPTS